MGNPRITKLAIGSVALWLLLGWAYGDEWRWTIIRAVAVTATILGVVALYASAHVIARVSRVALGGVMGAWCAHIIGGDTETTITVGAAFIAVMLGCESLIGRGPRSGLGMK